MPASVTRVALFQLVNVKAWMMVITALAALSDEGGALLLALLILVISVACLSLWAWAGALTARFSRRTWTWVDRIMAALLMLSGVGLVVDVVAGEPA